MLFPQHSHDHSRSARRRLAVLSATTATALGLAVLAAPSADADHGARHQGSGHHSTGHHHGSRPTYRDARLPTKARVADLLGRMTLAEKIGQMAQAERADIDADTSQITSLGLGSVLSGGGSVPGSNTPEAWANMVDRYQRAALQTRLGIPLLYGVDSVHGHGNLDGATIFPHNIGLGASRDARLVKKIGHITAIETRASGPQWAFAPCICVARDDRWGRTYESFGEDPRLVRRMETVIDGLQGRKGQLDRPDHVLATAKHYAGDGLTSYRDTPTDPNDYPIDQGVDEVSHAEFARLALSPYPDAVRKHHIGSVMPSFSSVDWTEDGLGNPIKMSANRELITGVLKHALGFQGLVISDWRAIHQLPGTYADQVEASVNAGIDMFMEPFSGDPVGYPQFISTLTQLVNTGAVPMSRINDAVRRILTVKFKLGLFEHPYTDRSLMDTIGSRAHRAVARRAVAESQVLLTNKRRTLPLSKRAPVYVAGGSANSMGNQAGGWTLTWQGSPAGVIPGTTILGGIQQATNAPVTFSQDASAPVPADANGVVVVGETPYAEGPGDVAGPSWAPNGVQTMQLSAADRAAIDTVCSQAATCTVLVVSGRPIILPPEVVDEVDSLVASWLPGSEGQGVADVLFGREPFTGRLPVTWPRTLDQEPINVGDAARGKSYDPLFPYGWGLTTRRR
ncbi:beta-glucosidase [Nocardioides terrae]|uniref:beta-glucosidase n=1 Tax=Nocardioides terrae TaxID=574651 RepID=A0A1I1J5X8_9ACTN|nr:glycoside hydrolase family 3 N-terminal domain-containing protein [Nocardioides terrae]SFC43402.1 beta-glucosidase [Nocardioides terrae]